MTDDSRPTEAGAAGSRRGQLNILRLSAFGLAGALLIATMLVAPPLVQLFVPRRIRRSMAIGLLIGVEVAYFTVWAACLISIPWLVMAIIRARRRGQRRPFAARLLLVSISSLFAALAAEGGASIFHAQSIRSPEPAFVPDAERPPDPSNASEPAAEPGEIFVVVIGESSAEGVPFKGRLSIGEIVAWQLRKVLSDRKVRVEVQARSGMNLAQMQRKLSGLTRRPDVLIIYAGHNEFSSRYPWSHEWSYYADDWKPRTRDGIWRFASRVSPLYRLIQEGIMSQQVDEPPPSKITRGLVDVPIYTPKEYAATLADFRARLDAMVESSHASGVATVLVLPPANDAGYEPNRSSLSPETPKAERDRFASEFLEARRGEATDPAASEATYRALLSKQPRFAEAHFRLARLLERSGRPGDAYPHFVAARDLDGLPMRCPTEFQDVYREVAARRGASLIDGQALFRSLGVNALLGDDLFNDAMHPALRGHIALAQAVLDRLRGRPELGWPEGTPAPIIDPIECAAHFGLDRRGWIDACSTSASIWRVLAYASPDPSERLAKARRFDRAVFDLKSGHSAESLGVPGVGLSPIGK